MRTDQFFRCLADTLRFNLLHLIWQEKDEVELQQLAASMEEGEKKLSRHAALLVKNQLIIERRHELSRYYRINPDMPKWQSKVLKHSFSAIKTEQELSMILEKESA